MLSLTPEGRREGDRQIDDRQIVRICVTSPDAAVAGVKNKAIV